MAKKKVKRWDERFMYYLNFGLCFISFLTFIFIIAFLSIAYLKGEFSSLERTLLHLLILSSIVNLILMFGYLSSAYKKVKELKMDKYG